MAEFSYQRNEGHNLLSLCLAMLGHTHLLTHRLMEGFMKYAENGSIAVTYIPTFIQTASGIQNLTGKIHRQDRDHISLL
jgi:hypothetical protein